MAGKEPQEDRLRDLEGRLRELEKELAGQSGGEGGAKDAIRGMSDVLSGLWKLLDGVGGSEALGERLRSAGKEIEARLKEAQSDGGERGGQEARGYRGSIPGRTSIPPVRWGVFVGSLGRKEPGFEVKEVAPKRRRAAGARSGASKDGDVLVDVFEEEDLVTVIMQMPGVEESDIKVELQGESLVVTAESPHRRYRKQVSLPRSPKGDPAYFYKNGVLEVRLQTGGE